jgi:2,3-bisphosphoglycerate-independent phosphoglycerate mutase
MSEALIKPRPVALVILDGWGIAQSSRGNAITQAQTPVYHKLISTYPTFTLQAGGEAVGLPWGEMGNSEVGHLTLGAGKILYQELPRITRAIVDQSFFQNQIFLQACAKVKERNGKLHILGMVSSGGVHSSNEHLYALLELAQMNNVTNIFVHAILDGRDTPFNSGQGFIKELESKLKKIKVGKIATLIGRFYAMDRDNHWERTQAAYECLVEGKGKPVKSAEEAIVSSYEAKVYDEELVPTVIMEDSKPVAQVSDGDVVIFFNFRADRARQLTKAFTVPDFDKFQRRKLTSFDFVSMTEYEKDLPVQVAFLPEAVEYPLGRVVSEAGLTQLRLAETEKYAHVTYFFNGGKEKAFVGEDHALVPSPVVSSYDQKPQMSARGITDKFLQEVRAGKYDFYVINYANADMVAHTGNLPATIKAVEVLDICLGEVVAATLEVGGVVFITADHGNAEGLINLQNGSIDKEHSNVPVPFIIVGHGFENKAASGASVTEDLSQLTSAGVLSDVAPTILKVLGVPKPVEMTGQSLL